MWSGQLTRHLEADRREDRWEDRLSSFSPLWDGYKGPQTLLCNRSPLKMDYPDGEPYLRVERVTFPWAMTVDKAWSSLDDSPESRV